MVVGMGEFLLYDVCCHPAKEFAPSGLIEECFPEQCQEILFPPVKDDIAVFLIAIDADNRITVAHSNTFPIYHEC